MKNTIFLFKKKKKFSKTYPLLYSNHALLCLQLFNTSDLLFNIFLLLQDATTNFSSIQSLQALLPALYLRHFCITSHFIIGSTPLFSLNSHT